MTRGEGEVVESRAGTTVAVVGFGYWGAKHAPVLSALEGVTLAIVESDSTRARRAQQLFPHARVVRDIDQVLDHVDGVVVATPPDTHTDIGLRALRAGRHLLVEKPLATSVLAAKRLVDTAAEQGVRLMVGHTFCYHAAVWKLRDLVWSGDLGRIVRIETERLNLGLYRSDVDVVWDLAPHDLSIIAFLMEETPASVTTWAHHNLGGRHADVAYVRLEFDTAATLAFVRVSWLNPQKVRRVTVVGDRKMAIYNDGLDEDRLRVYDVGVEPGESTDPTDVPGRAVTYRSGDIVSPHVPLQEPLLVQNSQFVDCIRAGQQPPTPGEHGLDVVRVLSASDLSHAIGRPVSVAEVQTSPGVESEQSEPGVPGRAMSPAPADKVAT